MKNNLNIPVWYICAFSGLADSGSEIHLYVGDKLCIPVIDFIVISYFRVPDACLSDGFDGSITAVTVCDTPASIGLWETHGFTMPVHSAIHRVQAEMNMLLKTVT